MSDAPLWRLLDLTENNPEHALFDSVNVEYADIAGFPIKYYIKEENNTDKIYGEDATTKYSEGYESVIVYNPEEQPYVIDIFGYKPDDNIQACFMPKTIFTRDIADGDTTIYPMVGDVILTLWNNKRYEISNVGAEQSIFEGKKLIWEFTLTPFTNSDESDESNDIIDFLPDEDDFPDINDPGFKTENLSAYGDDETIEEESNEIEDYDDVDTSDYGYDNL